jgi:hypothetical protein
MKTFYFLINNHIEGYIEGKTVYHQIIDVQRAKSSTQARLQFNRGIGKLFEGKNVICAQPTRFHTQYMVVDRNGNEMADGTLTQDGCPYYVVTKNASTSSAQADWVENFLASGKLHKVTLTKRLQRPKW